MKIEEMRRSRIDKVLSGAEYRVDEKLENFPNFGISIVVKFWKFVNFTI